MRRYPHLQISARGLEPSGTSTHLTRQLSGTHYAAVRLLVCSSTASSPRLPVAARDRQATAGQTRSPRFRRDPSIRDVALDPSRATVPRITAPHMLPSAVATASAPAISRISWLNPTPQTITVYASPWSSPSTTQHSLPGGRYPFPGPDFHRLDRASYAWRTATPSSRRTCTDYSFAGLPGALRKILDSTQARCMISKLSPTLLVSHVEVAADPVAASLSPVFQISAGNSKFDFPDFKA